MIVAEKKMIEIHERLEKKSIKNEAKKSNNTKLKESISSFCDKADNDDTGNKNDANGNLNSVLENQICSTLKVSNLGLGNSFFDNLDAKTLDNLVLAASQQKLPLQQPSSGAKFSDLSRHSRHHRVGSAFLQNLDNVRFRARKSIISTRNITQKARKSLSSIPLKSKENVDILKRSSIVSRSRFLKNPKKNLNLKPKKIPKDNKTPLPLTCLDLNISNEDENEECTIFEDLKFAKKISINCLCHESLNLNLEVSLFKQCQAIDYLDDKMVGCTAGINNPNMYRVSVSNPFLALCDLHQLRMKKHQCCPICSLFCIQGSFIRCTVTKVDHYFHQKCQILRNNKYFCPHCGFENDQKEIILTSLDSCSAPADVNNSSLEAICREFKDLAMITAQPLNKEFLLLKHQFNDDPFYYRYHEIINAFLTFSNDKSKPKVRSNSKNLMAACKSKKTLDLLKAVVMLNDGIDPCITIDDSHPSIFHTAAKSGNTDLIYFIFKIGKADILCIDRDLRTPLMEAAEAGKTQAVEMLIQLGSNIEAVDIDGMTALHLAAKDGHKEVVKLLLDTRRISINIKDNGGWSPLIWAIENSHVDTVKYLLSQEADPIAPDNDQNLAIHWAAYAGCVIILQIILSYKCDVNAQNISGDTPLHIAIRRDKIICVQILLQQDVYKNIKNFNNELPIDCAAEETKSIITYLFNQENKMQKMEKIVCNDLSRGREKYPISIINSVDEDSYPDQFIYVNQYVHSISLFINQSINLLSVCDCTPDDDNICNCLHNNAKCVYQKNGQLLPDFNFVNPPNIYECNLLCKCTTKCYNRIVQKGTIKDLQLFKTEGRGWGVRSKNDIPARTFICEYLGELITDFDANNREDDTYLFDLTNRPSGTYCVDAVHYGNISRFINHLCEPNIHPLRVWIDHNDEQFPRMCFFSTKDIKAYEELGFDYGVKFWIIKSQSFTCKCGSPICRYSTETIAQTIEDYNRRMEDD